MELIDTHAHLDMEYAEGETVKNIVDRASKNNVKKIITISSSPDSIMSAHKLAESFEGVYHSIGLHPHEAKDLSSGLENTMRSLNSKKCVAVGEVGLDYHYLLSPMDIQKKVFVKMIELARELGLPLIIHSREADKDTYEILKSEYKDICNGVLHCYSGSKEQLKKYLDLGMYVSFTGIITFPKAEVAKESALYSPQDRIMIETDCPFLAPVPHRGKKNYPEYIPVIASKLAEIKGQTLEEVAKYTTRNALDLFSKIKD